MKQIKGYEYFRKALYVCIYIYIYNFMSYVILLLR